MMTDPQSLSRPEQLFILFIRTARIVSKYYNTFLKKNAGLSTSQIATLTVLYFADGITNPSEIAERTFTEPNNVTTLISRMSKVGLVRTERNPDNKRMVNVILTEKGKKAFEQARPVVFEAMRQVTKALSEDNMILMENPLRILRQNAKDGLGALDDPSEDLDL